MKKAVVLFNLGGPQSLNKVRPFLFNLFYDPYILRLPNPFRWIAAYLISLLRHKKSQKIYEKMGGSSPLFYNTLKQAKALERLLNKTDLSDSYKVFIAMRYAEPFTKQTIQTIKKENPHEIILCPLYPHFSTTTTLSSLREWEIWAKKENLKTLTKFLCCYPKEEFFITPYVESIYPIYLRAKKIASVRLLFSAHSLPQKIIDSGDPYQQQVEQSAYKIVEILQKKIDTPIDFKVCYQSKVGPVKWLEPTLNDALENAAKDKVSVIIVPISFVSEHAETLVELDIDFKAKAEILGIPFYERVATIGTTPTFIEGLSQFIIHNSYPKRCNNPLKICGYKC